MVFYKPLIVSLGERLSCYAPIIFFHRQQQNPLKRGPYGVGQSPLQEALLAVILLQTYTPYKHHTTDSAEQTVDKVVRFFSRLLLFCDAAAYTEVTEPFEVLQCLWEPISTADTEVFTACNCFPAIKALFAFSFCVLKRNTARYTARYTVHTEVCVAKLYLWCQ